MRILGITGTIGAGKGTIVDYLVRAHGFRHYSVRALLTREIRRRGLPLDRDRMVAVANELRTRNSPSYLVEALYREAAAEGGDCIIESIRTPGEIDALAGQGGFCLLAVDAPAELRYERIRRRGSSTDGVDFATFLADEHREMRSEDPHKQNLAACIARADFDVVNNGSFDSLYARIEGVLTRIGAVGASAMPSS